MQQDNASFWADIKTYEEQLATNPDSFCFARLAEIYLKVGLVEDALHAARQGVMKHPGYVAGQRALALACHARGLLDECRAALELVSRAMPEDGDSLKMLARLYVETGNSSGAASILRTALEFNAGDVACRLELEAIERSRAAETVGAASESALPVADSIDFGFVPFDEELNSEEEIIEDVEILEIDETDLIEEEPSAFTWNEAEPAAAQPQQDPLVTSTLAELYVQQGVVSKALDIYRAILADDPANAAVQGRIAELEADLQAIEMPLVEETPFVTGNDFPESTFREFERYDAVPGAFAADTANISPGVQKGAGDAVTATLEGWLDNVRRMKECR